jgi:hypothetical protein
MTPELHTRRPVNPFSTRYIRPGCVAPLDAAGRPLPIAVLATRARATPMNALVGPHGSGKSNLLAVLMAELARRGPVRGVRVLSARDVPAVVRSIVRQGAGAVVGIDGWERLGPVGRWMIRGVARWRRCSLLVTAHHAVGVPVLVRCTSTPVLLEQVVAALPSHGGRIEPQDLAAAFARHAGNLREALLDLYDRFEERIRDESPAAAGHDGGDASAGHAGSPRRIHESSASFFHRDRALRT